MKLNVGETIVIPSPIESHVHAREPGGEDKETIESCTTAAEAGGYQAVFDMPNNPKGNETRSEVKIDEKIAISERTAHTKIGFWFGVDLDNPAFEQFRPLIRKSVGPKLYMGPTTGNTKVYDLDVARPTIDGIIKESKVQGIKQTFALHARNEIGEETAEYILSQGFKVNWCHLASAREVVAAIRLKRDYPGLFNAAVTLHHLTMTDRNADFQQGWHGARMQPPLGKEFDAEMLLSAYVRGYINILETDHAPHTEVDKYRAEAENPEGHTEEDCTTCYGITGIEHIIPVALSLVKRNIIPFDRLIDSVYTQPAQMLGLNITNNRAKTHIEIGPRTIRESDTVSKSSNHPYVGWTAWGKILGVENIGAGTVLKTGSSI